MSDDMDRSSMNKYVLLGLIVLCLSLEMIAGYVASGRFVVSCFCVWILCAFDVSTSLSACLVVQYNSRVSDSIVDVSFIVRVCV